MLRTVRIIGTATILATLFRLSQQVSQVSGHDPVPGYSVALGVVGLLFLVRAAASEFASAKVTVVQRDILWGLSAGAVLSLIARLTS